MPSRIQLDFFCEILQDPEMSYLTTNVILLALTSIIKSGEKNPKTQTKTQNTFMRIPLKTDAHFNKDPGNLN